MGKIAKVATERKLAEWIYPMLKERETLQEIEKMVNYRGKPALVIGQPQPEYNIVRLLVT